MTLSMPKVPSVDPKALKAVRDSLPGKLISRTAALMSLVLLVLGFAEIAQGRVTNLGLKLSPPWLTSALLIAVSSTVIALHLLNEWRILRDRRRALELVFTPAKVPQGYFRIGPYVEDDRKQASVHRADGAHRRVLDWLLSATAVPLYLTGDSGSGKSSLLNAFVLPELRDQGWTILTVRVAEDAEEALTRALQPPRPRAPSPSLRDLMEAAAQRARNKLLLVLDQFEEFVILAGNERQAAFSAMLAGLAERPIRGMKLLLVVRSDYQVALEELGLPRLRQGENFVQVGRFREGAARTFLEQSKLGLGDAALARLLTGAAELDDSPGLTRPITLNVLGYVLQHRGGKAMPSDDAGALVRNYIAEAVGAPEIRRWAPPVLEALITENGTKRPRAEDELARATKLRPAEVRAVLHSLANASLARPLDSTQSVWELSHDFIARAARSFLGRRRISVLRTASAYAAPALLVAFIAGGFIAVDWTRTAANEAIASLGRFGSLERDAAGLHLRADKSTDSQKLATLAKAAKVGSVVAPLLTLDLANTDVQNIDALKGLTSLRTLDLRGTRVHDINALKEMTSLETLNLAGTPGKVQSIEALRGLTSLRTLNLARNEIQSIDALKGLTSLQELDLSGNEIQSIDALKGLTSLKKLNLSGNQIQNIDALKGLTSLRTLELRNTRVQEIDALKGLTSLETLNLSNNQIQDIDALKGLTSLGVLDLGSTQVQDIDALKELTSLLALDLRSTRVQDIDALKGLTSLHVLVLFGTAVRNVDVLKGLTLLTTLDLMETQVQNVDALRGREGALRILCSSCKK